MSIPGNVEDLLPHDRPMVLVDEVLHWTASGMRAAVNIHDDHPFAIVGFGVPAHVGIEFMAQTCGIFSGIEAKRSNEKIQVGFLLGTRRYAAERDRFLPGERLEIEVTPVFCDGPMAVFDCRIESQGTIVATARLTLYRPDDPDAASSGQAME